MSTLRPDNDTTKDTRYHEHYGLLWKLKATVESLLAANASNVWSMYGGLNRLANQLDVILKHGLKNDACPAQDYWNFVFGLRRIQPVLAPSIDQLSRRAEQEGRIKGLLWLQDSLENHTLSFQLRMLVSETSHLREFYSDDAFLCSTAHSSALDILLQAVEQNNARLLAQVNPNLLQKCPSSRGSVVSQGSPRLSRTPSMSLEQDITPKPKDHHHASDSLLFASPKTESVLATSEDQAFGQSRDIRRNSAKEALKALLDGYPTEGSGVVGVATGNRTEAFATDPLLNRPAIPITRESFQRPHGLLRVESDTALLKTSVSRRKFDENDNRFSAKRKGSSGLAQNGNSDLSLSSERDRGMYWEDAGDTEDLDDHSDTNDIHSKLVFTYDNSPSSSNFARTLDSSTEEIPSSKSATLLSSESGAGNSLEPGYRTKDTKNGSSLNSSHHSLLHSSSEQLLFSEEEEDQFGFLGEVARRGRQSKPLHRRNSEDLDGATPSPPPVQHKYRRHTRSMSDQISNVRGGGFEDSRRDFVPERKVYNGKRSKDDIYSSSLPSEPLTARRVSDVSSASPACDGYFPQPSQGESLFTFLSSQDFATCPEVDKENAHFCISEAIIAAVEQIKCRQLTRQTPSDHESDGSDEEIQRLKQRIRLRRTEKRERKLQCEQDQSPPDCDIWSPEHDGTDSPQFLSDSEESMEEAEDFVVTDTSLDTNLVAMKTKGLTASLGSLYSDADLKKANKMHPIETVIPLTKIEPSSSHQLSAESIALSLIKKFSFRQLPAASELEWLVSEKDAPQQLLPLPKSVPISPDDGENADLYKNMRLRGNLEWAPPRPQIVFSIHPPPKRKQLIAKQNFRCAGCGMKAERGFLKRLRYCEYLGKYFCQCCHTNASSPIPSRILRKWDFSRYPVSNFSQELLSKIQTDPVFNVVDVNPILYRKVKQMQAVKDLRTQLFFLKDFLKTCRLCDRSLKASYDSQPGHWMGQPDLYSLSDLINVRSGEMEKALAQLVLDGVTHVSQCQLCQAKGFVCELCNKDEIIFPFQLNSTFQCLECWACYHTVCFLKESKCPKCERILARRGVSAVKTETSDEDTPSSSSS
ncbi:run domain Beclin-1-interacting and cysteine-rich domain-containing protein-like isoform X1 [Lytechinus variegatus]|uniref:run domain Beclin-1-interacting and cysteine-rich domain-containing protein-like isoform X1 n=2 Tax=Lytechinus variegatus TaxID=7654 RepID=UPI001BB11A9C|nr:run domain Beclin-1-interacting and cysteine-rich domain-containing protein-like isoform X1 [Lytechinus variegatus]